MNFVGVAAEGALVIAPDPVEEVVVFPTVDPVEDDVAVEAFVGLKVAAFEHVAFHEVDEVAALVGDLAEGVVHGLFGEFYSVAGLVEFALAVVGEVVEVVKSR